MVYNLSTHRGTPSYAGSGKFGSSSLSGAVVRNTTPPDSFLSSTGTTGGTITTGTVEAWVFLASDPGALKIFTGHDNWFWMGITSGRVPTARYGGSTQVDLTGSSAISTGAWHHFALVMNGGSGSLYVDGSRVATSASTTTADASSYGFCVGGFGANDAVFPQWDWPGYIDEVRLSDVARYTGSTYTVPTAAFTDSSLDTNTKALYHFEGNANDTAQTVTQTIIDPSDTGIRYSPYNWKVASGLAETINAGAYFKTLIAGSATSVALTFDMASVSSPVPQISYRVDQGPWTTAPVAASVSLTMPSGNTWTKHTVEVVVKATSETVNRWNSTRNATVKLTGITVGAAAGTAAAPTARDLRILVYGDSITEGVRTLNSGATDDTDRNNALQGWAWQLAEALGAEVGVVGFGGQGILATGSGNVPTLPNSYDLLWSGQARSFTSQPDLVVVNIGTNDGTSNTVSAMTGLLNDLLTDTTARIAVLRPFGGGQASNLQSAIAACSNPLRVTYVDTTGWWSTSDASDSVHPYGYANVHQLAPRVAAALRDVLARGATYVNIGGEPVAAGVVRK